MLHLELKEAIDLEFATAIAEPAELCRDALLVRLQNGVTIEIRIASAEEYAIGWRWGEAELRIDTAPLHRQLATFPHHLHDAAGRLRPDPITLPGRDARENVRDVITTLLEDPLLQARCRGD